LSFFSQATLFLCNNNNQEKKKWWNELTGALHRRNVGFEDRHGSVGSYLEPVLSDERERHLQSTLGALCRSSWLGPGLFKAMNMAGRSGGVPGLS
jgi:hypothetical protein